MSEPALVRLQQELQRLFLLQAAPDGAPDADGLTDAAGRVRALVLALAQPADWQVLSRVWGGVQADLALPAPAIAVSGQGALALWFSLAEPVAAEQAHAFLEALRQRYLHAVRPDRVSLMPMQAARRVPAEVEAGGRWSAFVAQDLAPMFADEAWLDMAPSPNGQADLLSRLVSTPVADFRQALQRLSSAAQPPGTPGKTGPSTLALEPMQPDADAPAAAADPRHFLLQVMQDESVALSLRIEAAKALLPYVDSPTHR